MAKAASIVGATQLRVRTIPLDRPWFWLAEGWRDLTSHAPVSLAYGALLVVISFALTLGLILANLGFLILPLAAGFFFVAPVLAVGLYECSRRRQKGLPVTLGAALTAWRVNASQIAYMGLILMLFNLAWVRIATLLYALFFGHANPTLDTLANTLLFSPMSLPFLAIGTLTGALLAAVVYALGAVALPMLLDRDVDVITAISTSFAAVLHNWRPMALWAALIVIFTTIGMALFYVGLAVALPLVGHASWYAYRDLVE
jgi:uncharacterized membrane protein